MSVLLPWIRCFTENTINRGMSKCNVFFPTNYIFSCTKTCGYPLWHLGYFSELIISKDRLSGSFDEAPVRRRQMSEDLKPRRPGEAEYPKNS